MIVTSARDRAGAEFYFRSRLDRERAARQFLETRQFSEEICRPLETEDYVVQSMEEASPVKWHLAHTSWFFETFLLSQIRPDYQSMSPQFSYLFNSYYVQAGERHPRPRRGMITRPTVEDVYQYRKVVTEQVLKVIENSRQADLDKLLPVIEIGINHEQQHQELILTDLKHLFSQNPLMPAYVAEPDPSAAAPASLSWIPFEGGLIEIGHDGDGFCFDNELPRHRRFAEPFELADRPVTVGEYLEFMGDGGYREPTLWLSDGWARREERGWESPLYWRHGDNGWEAFTLFGLRALEPSEPVCHVSYYEADAFARWAGARLPREEEWETAAAGIPTAGGFAEDRRFHPRPAPRGDGRIRQMAGDVWEWTQSAYLPYPGYQPPEGAIGEYNGKFMCNQFVLRGGSCATSRSHIRPTYRNFFYPDARWQFAGIRLARDADAS
ncbi:MAG TPA: ergothioneine biosynthesis protein EgtB [Acidobacteriota bacterium]|nr:ergothioneine biosynthesis protein EgtB [Acidobacteriota bacterium]